MNLIHRNDHLGSYRRVENGYRLPNWSKIESSIYTKPSFSWKKGSRVNTSNEWLTIKIGGDDLSGKKRKKLKNKSNNRIKSTKYSLITFLPQNLLEQFRRIANFYFLVMTIIGLVIDSPVSPMTSLLPLAFVISVTAAKQGYEDYLRYKTDNIVNCSPVTVIRNGTELNIECQDVVQGDLVLVLRDCDVPCDLILLKSSDPHGKCFITTANLDGESNLKTLLIPRGLPDLDTTRLHTLGTIECESPKFDLYSFNGKIMLANNDAQYLSEFEQHSSILPLSSENVLLRGSRVKNTEFVIGCACYTGMDTKLALNSRMTRSKVSSAEKYINKFLVFILITLILLVTILFFLKRYYEMFVIEQHRYLGPPHDVNKVSTILQDYLSFFILFNYLIPISLYVTIEMNRILGGFFMEWDIELYDYETDQQCIVNTSNLNEELGQINILFSDKTGTLTKNEMIFQQCSINGKKFIFKKTKLMEQNSVSDIDIDINKFNDDQRIFFQALALCHSVQVAGKVSLHEDSEEHIQNGNAQKIHSISDITEESHNSSSQSDEIDSIITPSAIKRNLDNNPLLDKKLAEAKRNKIVKRSPRFTRPSRIHPSQLEKIISSDSQLEDRPISYPSSPPNSATILTHQKAFPFNRSTSHIDLPSAPVIPNISSQTHRRTQSYGANPNNQRSSASFLGLRRSPSTLSTRESYASPNFISRTSILRAESQRRKQEIQSVVEKLDYQASSPDEKALLEACAFLGMVYLGDDDDILKIQICPPHLDYSKPYAILSCKEFKFKRLHTIEFSSDRKRMSVIIKDRNDEIWVYTKGAESYVFPLCSKESSLKIQKTDNHISEFARLGLRTLAVARRKLTSDEYQEFLQDIALANDSLEDRGILKTACYAKIERHLELLGATAVEDALQDDVESTLIAIQKAGIKVWVLTGDKVETALNIAISCGHVSQTALKYFIIECKSKEDFEEHLKTFENEINSNQNYSNAALIIDGKSLTIALRDYPARFRDTAIKCQAVLCCRLSPLQKCEVVQLIKTSKEKYITAAIGDGANDVSMIQEAHVGVGITGKEGRQAARCSDFAFANFRMLRRLLLVHGHYHTTRLSFLVLYFFYKNIFFMGIQALFQFHTMFSSTSIYDSLFLTLYNVLYTALPILFISLTEKPYSERLLMEKSELYKRNINNKALHWGPFISWILIGVYHSLVCFYAAYYVFSINSIILPTGRSVDYSCFGIILMQNVIIVANFKLWLETKYQSYWYIFTIWISIFAFVGTTLVYNVLNIRYDTDIYFAYNNLFTSIPFYLLSILVITASLLPDYAIRISKLALNLPKRHFFPGDDAKAKKSRIPRIETQSTYL